MASAHPMPLEWQIHQGCCTIVGQLRGHEIQPFSPDLVRTSVGSVRDMKIHFILLCFAFSLVGCNRPSPSPPEASDPLVIYAYDSFAAEGGLGPAVIPHFEKSSGCTTRLVGVGDAGHLLNRVQLEKKRGGVKAQVIIGIDQNNWESVREHARKWGDQVPQGYRQIPKALRVEEGFLPFDYGVYTFIADTTLLKKRNLPVQEIYEFKKFREPRWKNQIILQDPRTSTPGLAFVKFLESLSSDSFGMLSKQWSKQWLTLTPGWSAAYGLFLKEQAPLVWSYTTSEAYHRKYGKTQEEKQRYRAVQFKEGHPIQIEGVALLEGEFSARQTKCAQQFLDFVLSPEFQGAVPLKNWMFPVIPSTPLPKEFQKIPRPKKWISSRPGSRQKLIQTWSQSIR